MEITWDQEKNILLKKQRDVTFEDVLMALNSDNFKKVIHHPNRLKYPHQKILLVELYKYIYSVPFVENETGIFLKTIYKSRKFTKLYLNKEE